MKLRFSIWAVFAAAVISLFSLLLNSQETMVLATRSEGSVIDDVYDSEESRHPSGNDRNIEPGKSGTQGKSTSNPDGNGADKRRTSSDGSFGGTQGRGDYDDNNGCGNDNDFADDNNGNCGGKPRPSPTPSPRPSHKPKASPAPTPSPSPIGGTTTNNNTNNNNQTQTQTQNNNQTVNVTVNAQSSGQVLGAAVPVKQPETGLPVLGFATMFGAVPVGLVLTRFGRGRIAKKTGLESVGYQLFSDRQNKRS